MTESGLPVTPPDDAGFETLGRYVYQAKVIFAFALQCGLGGSIRSVIPEHIEDCCLELAGSWRFLQIKSRDTGTWTLSDLLAEGGPLRSLLRAYLATRHLDATYELFLEQPLSRHGISRLLENDATRTSEEVVTAIVDGLDVSKEVAETFVQRLRVKPDLPARSYIDDVNLRLILAQRPTLSYALALEIYRRLLDAIVSAMSGERMEQPWPLYAVSDDGPRSDAEARLRAKKLSASQLNELVPELTSAPSGLLTRAVQSESRLPSVMEQKLLAAGATDQIVDDAKDLRARALEAQFERLALSGAESGNYPSTDEALHEVQRKLLLHAHAACGVHAPKAAPAPHVWDHLLTSLISSAATIDPDAIFHKSPYVLLGALCELSDQCHVGWGLADA